MREELKTIAKILVALDRGIVVVVSKTGLAWSLLLLYIALTIWSTDTPKLYNSIVILLTFWPMFTAFFGVGIGIVLFFYSKDGSSEKRAIYALRMVSGLFVVLALLMIGWKERNWQMILTGVIIILIPLIILKVEEWRKQKNNKKKSKLSKSKADH